MVEPYAMVGGAAASLLFHTLRICIFTTAPECTVLTHQLGAAVQVASKTTTTAEKGKNQALANKRSEKLMWTTSGEPCKTGCSGMTANANLPLNDHKTLAVWRESRAVVYIQRTCRA